MSVGAHPGRVLVVDDNADNRALAKATLEDEGYDVVLVSDGPSALRHFEAEAFDCVLLDIRMPGMDGLEVCTQMRAMPRGQTPILFLTALRDLDTFDRASRVGAVDFLTKPILPTELVIRVETAIKLQRIGDELRTYYDTVRQQRDDLRRLQLQKERLSAFVVHDLKNPVSTMDLHAQLMLREPDLAPRARDSAQRIREEARSLLRLLLNLLDISKSEEGELQVKQRPTDLTVLVGEVIRELQARAEDHNVKLMQEGTHAGEIDADAELLRRVLENLIENALRHAPEQSEVRVEVEEAAEAVQLRVIDAGRGIPQHMRASVFERFVQLDQPQAVTRSGRGLGLAFCKLAVEAHGGSIWIEDANPGAMFCIRLPR